MPGFLAEIVRRPPVGWWDILDIAVVSFLIYEFLKLIRGTRAVQMAVGSLLIVGLFYVSRLAPLQTVNWMIRNMLVYLAFAAIVIFQSDIRRALAHFGQAPFFRYLNRQEAADETIEEIVVAATMLAAQRIGAIVAVEREIGLRNYIESGIPLDATLTYDLLVTIFHPGSPLHDGAGDPGPRTPRSLELAAKDRMGATDADQCRRRHPRGARCRAGLRLVVTRWTRRSKTDPFAARKVDHLGA